MKVERGGCASEALSSLALPFLHRSSPALLPSRCRPKPNGRYAEDIGPAAAATYAIALDGDRPQTSASSRELVYLLVYPLRQRKEKRAAALLLQPVDFIGGVDGARTRDPRRDRPVF